MTEQDREEASEIVKNAFGRRPGLQDGEDYVDEVRGHEQNELRKKVARILHKTIRQFEVEKCPIVFDLRVHIDQIHALYADKIEQAVKKERERILKELKDGNVICLYRDKSLDGLGLLLTMEHWQALKGDTP